MRIKLTVAEQKNQIMELEKEKAQLINERDRLRERCKTLEYASLSYLLSEIKLTHIYSETIGKFVSTMSAVETFIATGTHTGSANPTACLPLPIFDLPKMPDPIPKPEDVKFWYKRDYQSSLKDQKKETNVLATVVKKKRGRPTKADEDENDSHPYLEMADGTPVSTDILRLLSQKARRTWMVLHEKRRAPSKWRSMAGDSYDFYLRTMVTDPDFQFLLLCNDREWKLDEWSKRSYSSWAVGAGIREPGASKNVKKEKSADARTLDDVKLFRMSQTPEDTSDTSTSHSVLTEESSATSSRTDTPNSDTTSFDISRVLELPQGGPIPGTASSRPEPPHLNSPSSISSDNMGPAPRRDAPPADKVCMALPLLSPSLTGFLSFFRPANLSSQTHCMLNSSFFGKPLIPCTTPSADLFSESSGSRTPGSQENGKILLFRLAKLTLQPTDSDIAATVTTVTPPQPASASTTTNITTPTQSDGRPCAGAEASTEPSAVPPTSTAPQRQTERKRKDTSDAPAAPSATKKQKLVKNPNAPAIPTATNSIKYVLRFISSCS